MKYSLTTASFVVAMLCACQAQNSHLPASPSEAACTPLAPDPAALPTENTPDRLSLDDILAKLRQRTSEMRSYQADIHYLFIQDPELLDAHTLRKGIIYYQKGDGRSRLRVHFSTIKQDDAPQRERLEQFFFDGVWLTKIDYELKTVDFYQQAAEDNPQDVFEYISHNFPIVGFSSTETLRKQFDISILDQPADPNQPIRLHLKVKKDSVYKDDYRDIDFSIDGRTWLPLRIVARSTEDDIYDMQFLKAVINKKLENSVFVIETPKSFSKNRHPLEKDREREK